MTIHLSEAELGKAMAKAARAERAATRLRDGTSGWSTTSNRPRVSPRADAGKLEGIRGLLEAKPWQSASGLAPQVGQRRETVGTWLRTAHARGELLRKRDGKWIVYALVKVDRGPRAGRAALEGRG